MKYFLLLSFVFFYSCSNWQQKDFEKSLDDTTPGPSGSSEIDPNLMHKFEVGPAPSTQPGPVEKVVKKVNAPVKKNIVEKPKVKSKMTSTPPQAMSKLPEDYPPELSAVNQKAKEVWSLYRPNHRPDQKIFLDIHYLGMTVGKIMVTNKGKNTINGREVWHFHSRFKSAPFYSNIYELDDVVDTYVTTNEFLSLKYGLIQRESKQDVDDVQLHDREQLKTFWFYKQKKSNGKLKEKKEEKYIPYYSIDPFSVVFFYQGLPLKDKDLYEIPIINKGKILILRSEVEGREQIETELGKKKAIRVHAVTKYTGDQLKSGDLYFWFSDDNERTLLKAKAKIKIGSVTADIVEKK